MKFECHKSQAIVMRKMARYDEALKQVEQARLALRPNYADKQKKEQQMAEDIDIDLVHAKIFYKLQ